ALLSDLPEASAVTVEPRFLARLLLPTEHGDVDVLGVDINSEANAAGLLGGNQRGARAQERIVDDVSALGVVQYRPAHQLDWFLCTVAGLLLLSVAAVRIEVGNLPQSRLCPVPLPVGLFKFPNGIPAGLVLPVIAAPAHDEVLLRPDDLRP